ncbi:MAG: hypothetical protein NTW87_36750, partial [Planctomycetota bacterium]|nr:hypothetical protein [Planctomycetota bacterium]
RLQKDNEALVEIAAALRSTPGSKDLKEIKASLESLQACTAIYGELQKVVEAALGRVRDLREIDSEDERARDLRDTIEKLRDRFTEAAGKPRPAFLAHNHQAVQTSLTTARSDAGALAKELSGAADVCERKAEKAAEKGSSVKGPFGFSVGLGGDKKKAEKYRNLTEGFRKLAEQARAQSK